jgi:D-lyxose ketol-isomerase
MAPPDTRAPVHPAGTLTAELSAAACLCPGEVLRLSPGESVTLMPGNWHAFWGEGGDVLIGEVSTVNNDLTDNIFAEPIGRFAEIEEDVEPWHLLVSDYSKWLG